MKVSLHDLLAVVVTVLLLVGVFLLYGLGREVPDVLTGAFGAAMGYAFRGGVAAMNNHRRVNRQ